MELNMTDFLSRKAISQVAALHGVPESEVREEMDRALLMAWGTGDNRAMDVQDCAFPGGLPTLEVFIGAIAEALCKD